MSESGCMSAVPARPVSTPLGFSTDAVMVSGSRTCLMCHLDLYVRLSPFYLAILCLQCSQADIGSKMRQDIAKLPAVHISNPKTLEFQVLSRPRIVWYSGCTAAATGSAWPFI